MQENKGKYYSTDAQKLRDFMQNLRYCDYNNVRRKIVEACMVRGYIFANWLSGRSRIPELAKQKINEITGTNIF